MSKRIGIAEGLALGIGLLCAFMELVGEPGQRVTAVGTLACFVIVYFMGRRRGYENACADEVEASAQSMSRPYKPEPAPTDGLSGPHPHRPDPI
jgi:hypothetical protein